MRSSIFWPQQIKQNRNLGVDLRQPHFNHIHFVAATSYFPQIHWTTRNQAIYHRCAHAFRNHCTEQTKCKIVKCEEKKTGSEHGDHLFFVLAHELGNLVLPLYNLYGDTCARADGERERTNNSKCIAIGWLLVFFSASTLIRQRTRTLLKEIHVDNHFGRVYSWKRPEKSPWNLSIRII